MSEDAGEANRLRARKAPTAFRTISEVAEDLRIPQHVLRFWETKLDGKLNRVIVAHQALIKPGEFRYFGGEFLVN
jgi:uncharacterized protein Usg